MFDEEKFANNCMVCKHYPCEDKKQIQECLIESRKPKDKYAAINELAYYARKLRHKRFIKEILEVENAK